MMIAHPQEFPLSRYSCVEGSYQPVVYGSDCTRSHVERLGVAERKKAQRFLPRYWLETTVVLEVYRCLLLDTVHLELSEGFHPPLVTPVCQLVHSAGLG